MQANKNRIDVSGVFLTYMQFVGDVEKTALALNMDVAQVEDLAKREDWNAKVRSISLLSKGGNPGDFERATNRALNYVQAHRMRLIMEEVVERIVTRMKENDNSDYIMVEVGAKFVKARVNARFFADMAAAIEKMQALSYMALGDAASDRKQASTSDPENKGAVSIHAAVIDALNGALATKKIPESVFIAVANPPDSKPVAEEECQNGTIDVLPG